MDLPAPPLDLPFLVAISWFDQTPHALAPREMLGRYEAGWKHLGVLGELGEAERSYVQLLIDRFGSELDLPTR